MPVEESLRTAAWLRERMAQRRTVRAFSTDPVDERLVVDAIAVAATAPSSAHQQPWTFVLVTARTCGPGSGRRAEAEERRSYGGRLGAEWLAVLLTALHLAGLAALIHTPSLHAVPVRDPQPTTRRETPCPGPSASVAEG